VLALGHGLGAGSDATSPWSLMLTGARLLVVGIDLRARRPAAVSTSSPDPHAAFVYLVQTL